MFSLRSLFVVVGIAAVAAGAVVSQATWMISGFVLLTLGILCWAALRREAPFWRGLFVFGAVYLAIAVSTWLGEIKEVLPSQLLHNAMIDTSEPPIQVNGDGNFRAARDRAILRAQQRSGSAAAALGRTSIAIHSICSLLFGTIGGLLFQWHTERKKGGT